MGLFSYGVWAAICLAKLIALVAAGVRRPYRHLNSLKGYLVVSLMGEACEFIALQRYGFTSHQYRYAYFASDLTITILGFFVLVHLLEKSFEQTSVHLPGLRSGAMLVFSGAATISGFYAFHRFGRSLPAFSTQLEQNLSFVGMVLTLLLWIAMNLMRLPGVRFRRVVLAFGVLYSSGAIIYSIHSLFGDFSDWRFLVPLSSLLEAGLLAYTLVGPDTEVPSGIYREEMDPARKPA